MRISMISDHTIFGNTTRINNDDGNYSDHDYDGVSKLWTLFKYTNIKNLHPGGLHMIQVSNNKQIWCGRKNKKDNK